MMTSVASKVTFPGGKTTFARLETEFMILLLLFKQPCLNNKSTELLYGTIQLFSDYKENSGHLALQGYTME